MRRILVAAALIAFTMLPAQPASAQAAHNVIDVHKKVADLSATLSAPNSAAPQQQQQFVPCTGEIDIDFQIVTFLGQPIFVRNIVLTAVFDCDTPNLVICSDLLQGLMTPPLTVGVANGGATGDCTVRTFPLAMSIPGGIALGEASVLDTGTGASANFGPYLIVFAA